VTERDTEECVHANECMCMLRRAGNATVLNHAVEEVHSVLGGETTCKKGRAMCEAATGAAAKRKGGGPYVV